jgi:23S rRNA (pseudouridine1915-N3)-methyltransferase
MAGHRTLVTGHPHVGTWRPKPQAGRAVFSIKCEAEGNPLQLILASISPRKNKPKSGPAELLTQEYVTRAGHFEPTETAIFDSEAALLAAADRQPNRPAAHLILFDPRGESLTSERFAQHLGRLRDDGARRIVLAIGPADGWSPTALARAHKKIAFGAMTLPHELARTVLAEQIYRALTILAGHPYHSGH